jgi:hypothetical protein
LAHQLHRPHNIQCCCVRLLHVRLWISTLLCSPPPCTFVDSISCETRSVHNSKRPCRPFNFHSFEKYCRLSRFVFVRFLFVVFFLVLLGLDFVRQIFVGSAQHPLRCTLLRCSTANDHPRTYPPVFVRFLFIVSNCTFCAPCIGYVHQASMSSA